MARGPLTAEARWFEAQTAGAPADLRRRAAEYFDDVPPAGSLPARLAGAAGRALDTALGHSGGRAAALDLLAADALITLALLAQADEDPVGLGRFAARIRTEQAAR